jgi:hypothetical protein
MNEPLTIKLAEPLPCCALVAVRRRCGQPATVAQATRLGDGSYHVQPFCTACVAAMAKVYGVATKEESACDHHES